MKRQYKGQSGGQEIVADWYWWHEKLIQRFDKSAVETIFEYATREFFIDKVIQFGVCRKYFDPYEILFLNCIGSKTIRDRPNMVCQAPENILRM